MMAGSSKSYWHLSKSFATNSGMSNKWLEEQGLVNIKALWCKASRLQITKLKKWFAS